MSAIRPRIRSDKVLAIILVTVCVVVISVDFREGDSGPLAAAGRTAMSVVAPLQEAVSKVTRPVENFLSALTSLPSLKRENEELEAKVASLEAQLAASSSQLTELRQLEEIFELSRAIDRELVYAQVIGNGLSNFEWTLTIDKGSGDGIRVNDAVLSNGGVVGRVVEVTGGAAKVRMIVDPTEAVAARITLADGSEHKGIVLGQGDRNMTMELVDPDIPSADLNNRPVTTIGWAIEGRTNVYPNAIPIGTVSVAKPSEGELAKEVEVRPSVDLSAVDTVIIVKQPEGV